jgi:hypothetical protein
MRKTVVLHVVGLVSGSVIRLCYVVLSHARNRGMACASPNL